MKKEADLPHRGTEAPEAALADDRLEAIEALAVELANLAGAEIATALGRTLAVRYKSGLKDEEETWRNPVSEVDHRVETLIRARLAERFPEHDVIGEEIDERPGRGHDFVWVVDPVDGTTNFINGFPLFAASLGVLHHGRPVVGAIWCAATHALRAGVYHAREGHGFFFDGASVMRQGNPHVRRYLAAVPGSAQRGGGPWEIRKTGSAAMECALAAAGLLRVARFESPNIWDVAGGVALVRAAGGAVRERSKGKWMPLERFEDVGTAGASPDLRNWRRPLILGEAEAVARMCRAQGD